MNKIIFVLIITILSGTLFGQTESESLDTAFSTAGKQLTDEQAKASQDFVHQGLKEKAINQGCKDKTLQDCNPNPVDEGVLFKGGLGAALENNISKLYTVFFGGMGFLTGGGGPKVTASAKNVKGADTKAAPAATDGSKAKKETKTDYCMYGAMGGEVIAQGMQMTGQSQAQQSTASLNDPQLQALANLKETHKTRKKSATLQSTVYTAVTACYAARLAFGGVAMDASYIAKMGAAAGIAMLYKAKAGKHAKAMAKVQEVIDSLPKAGDCNPYTGTACFCKEKTSETLYPSQYQEVCVLNGGNPQGLVTVSGCAENTSGSITYDEDCSCKKTNTCYSTTVKTFNPNFSLGKNFMNNANTGFDLAENGVFEEGQLKKFTDDANALFARVKDKVDTSKIPKKNLTDAQKKDAIALSDFMPSAVANMAAGSEPGEPSTGGLMNGGTASALEKIPDSFKKKLDAEISGNYSSNGSSGSSAEAETPFTMPKLGNESAAQDGSEVVSFSEKALDGAEVSNRPDAAIFDIISNRYRSSGWNKVKIETP